MTDERRLTRTNVALIEDLAESCVRYIERATGLSPDFTPDTLPYVDHWLRGIGSIPSAEVHNLIVPAAGAYFGEVIRKHYKRAHWHLEGENFEGARLEFEHVFLHFNPFGMAIEAVHQNDAAGWNAHLQVQDRDETTISESLERTGDIRDDDYYRLAIRYEAIDQVVAILESLGDARKETNIYLGHEAYETEFNRKTKVVLH